jgi:hypothetical protein
MKTKHTDRAIEGIAYRLENNVGDYDAEEMAAIMLRDLLAERAELLAERTVLNRKLVFERELSDILVRKNLTHTK